MRPQKAHTSWFALYLGFWVFICVFIDIASVLKSENAQRFVYYVGLYLE